jgi:hypothetical protein
MGERRAGRDRIEAVGNRRQDIVVDLDETRRILGYVAAVRDNHRDRLADIAGFILRQHHGHEELRDGGVWNEKRERLLRRFGQIGIGQHEVHTG